MRRRNVAYRFRPATLLASKRGGAKRRPACYSFPYSLSVLQVPVAREVLCQMVELITWFDAKF
jgi:hypothetical protein